MIKAEELCKTYNVPQKEEGLFNSVKSFFRREYRTVEAVRNISFTIDDSEIVGLIGLNGAGKTTTLKMLSGLICPTSGSVEVMGYLPWKKENEFLKRIGFLMGNKSQLSWDIAAVDSFALEADIYKIARKEFRETLDELAALLEVENLLHTPVRKLSLGERMKMELILTLLHKPQVLFLDEPTLGLDIISQNSIRNFLGKFRDNQKATIIITSHNMKDIEELCERAIILDKGKIVYDGSIQKLKQDYSNIKLVKVRYSKNGFTDMLRKKIDKFDCTIEEKSASNIVIKVDTNYLLNLKNILSDIDGIEEIMFDTLSFEDILSSLLNGERL